MAASQLGELSHPPVFLPHLLSLQLRLSLCPGHLLLLGVSTYPCVCVRLSVFVPNIFGVQDDAVNDFWFICGCTFLIGLVSVHIKFPVHFFFPLV